MDAVKIKKDFPILNRKINGKPLVYLDNAATTQKPRQVIEALVDYYENHNANVHRGIHTLGDESTKMYMTARQDVARFLGCKPKELIFVRNTTEAINLVAYAWARENIKEGEVIVCSELEHHSNLVTWQEVAKATGAGVVYVSVTNDGQVDMEELELLLDEIGGDVRLVALGAVSNATGAELDIDRVVEAVKRKARGAKILIDGAQMVGQKRTDFQKMGVDFLAFSGHKMYGPMGIGGLVVQEELLKEMGPFLTGGGMINEVGLTGSTWAEVPDKFDAGTPDVAGAVGLAATCRYLADMGMGEVEKHGRELVEYALRKLSQIRKLRIVGPVKQNPKSETRNPKQIRNSNNQNSKLSRLGSVAFVYEGVHGHDVAQVLDSEGVAVRSGHHCTMPLHEKMGWVATTRASFGIYNSKEDVDRLAEALRKVERVFNSD